MALDLGELSGRIGLDITPVRKGVADVKGELRGVVPAAGQAGEEAGTKFGDGFADKGKAAAAAAGALVGAAIAYGVNGALEREASVDKMAASLGLNPREHARLGKIAGTLYANAYGESFEEVTTAVAAVKSSLRDLEDPQELRRATAKALDYAAVFEVDVARAVQVAGQMVNTGLVKNSQRAFDILTAASQRVPAAVREDLLDAGDEYGQFFKTLGFNGRDAFGVLVKASEDGMYGIDKAGDAIKEFTIRSTDMSTASKDAYEAIGLDARKMADDILAGGDDAKLAFDKIVDGLLGIESPSKRANTAIALFGTPLEDLNVTEIPKFLRGLSDTRKGFDDLKGSAREMGDTLADNASTKVTSFKRKMQGELIEFFANDVIPFLEDDAIPAIKDIGDALDSMPSWAIKGSVGGVLGLIAAGKLGSLVGNISKLRGGGGLTGAVSSLKPVPVVVTNPGFGMGAPGVPGGKPGIPPVVPTGMPGTPGAPGVGSGWKAAAVRAAMFAGPTVGSIGATGEGWEGNQALSDDAFEAAKTAHAALGSMSSAVAGMVKAGITGAQDVAKALAILPEDLITTFAVDGIPESRAAARDLVKQYDLTPEQKRTVFELLGFDETMGRARAIDAALDEAARARAARITITTEMANAGHQALGGPQERAGGGPVTRGLPYWVGEREPELFVPHTSGRILNQQQMKTAMGGGPAVKVAAPQVRVFIGDRELRDVIRVEIDDNEAFMEAIR